MLYGYSGIITDGALITIELALLSVVVAVIIGLAAASAKLFGSHRQDLKR